MVCGTGESASLGLHGSGGRRSQPQVCSVVEGTCASISPGARSGRCRTTWWNGSRRINRERLEPGVQRCRPVLRRGTGRPAGRRQARCHG
jgi:hypothetical protein